MPTDAEFLAGTGSKRRASPYAHKRAARIGQAPQLNQRAVAADCGYDQSLECTVLGGRPKIRSRGLAYGVSGNV